MTQPVPYEDDVVAWADQQARFLRERRFGELDIERLAEEIEDVGKSEQRGLLIIPATERAACRQKEVKR